MHRFKLLLCVLPLLVMLPSSEGDFGKKIDLPKLSKACKNIQCTPKEDRVCVKIKFMNPESTNKTIYIYMINDCEMQYMKCHENAAAVIVPKKYCEHSKMSSIDKGHTRIKRELKKASNKTNSRTATFKKVGNKQIHKYNHALRSGDEGATVLEGTDDDDVEKPAEATVLEGTDDDTENLDEATVLEGSDDDVEKLGETTALEGTDTAEKLDEATVLEGSDDDVEKLAEATVLEGTDDDAENLDEATVLEGSDNDSNRLGSTYLSIGDGECPSKCDVRAVMVCGKCQHGVYRTFLSPCHMRMFMCKNEGEELELMSRYPCVLSVPYAAEIGGVEKEPNDIDDVLRFIYCREAKEIGSTTIVDPRCDQFEKTAS